MKVVSNDYFSKPKFRYLVGLNQFTGNIYNSETVLVSAIDEDEAREIAKHLKPHCRRGEVKQVNY